MASRKPAAAVETELSRDMGLFDITMIGVGAMIGAGIFALTGIAAGSAGPALLLVFLLNGLVTLLTAFSYAELGSTFPQAGGGYPWVKEGLGGLNGFQAGWIDWFAHSVACSLYILAFGFYFGEFLNLVGVITIVPSEEDFGMARLSILPLLNLPVYDIPFSFLQKGLAVLVALLFGYINFRGVSETGFVGNVITLLKVLVLGLFVLSGLLVIFRNPEWWEKFTPFIVSQNMAGSPGWLGILVAMGLTYIAFEGYEIIVQSGEEVRDPDKNIPRAIFLALLIVVPFYLMVGFTALGATEIPDNTPEFIKTTWQYLGIQKEGAMVEAARQFMPFGYLLMVIGGLFSTMSALNATIYSSSRVSFAMGRDKNLPDLLGKVHERRRTPHMAIFLSVAIIILMAVVLPIEGVAAAASVLFILLFMQVNFALIALRQRQADVNRPYRVPLYPWTPLGAIGLQLILGFVLLVEYFHYQLYTIAWLVLGCLIYYSYVKGREITKLLTPVVFQQQTPTEGRRTICVPLAHPEHIADLMHLASSIARERDSEILAMNVIQVPEQLPLSAGQRYVEQYKNLLERAARYGEERDVPVNTLLRVAHRVSDAVVGTIKERKVDLLIMGWKGFSQAKGTIFGRVLDDVVRRASCDVMVVKMVDLENMQRILLPTAGGPHASFAVELAPIIASAYQSEITACMVVPRHLAEEERSKYQERVDEAVSLLREKIPEVRGELVESRSITAGIIKTLNSMDAVMLGATRAGIMQQLLFGTLPEQVARHSDKTVIMVRKYLGPIESFIERFYRYPRERVGRR